MQSILILLNKLNEGGRQDHTMQNLSDGILLAQIQDNYFNTDNKNVLFQAIYDNLNKLRTESQQDCQHYTSIDQHFIRYFLETIIQCNTSHVLDIIKSLSESDQKIIVNFLQNQSNLEIDDGYYTTILVDQLDKLIQEKESLVIHHNQLAQSQVREINLLQATVAELNTELDLLRDSQITFLQSVNECTLNDVKEKYLKNTMELLETKELMRKQKTANDSNQQLISKLELKLNEHQSDEKKNVKIEQVLVKDTNTQLQLEVLQQKLKAQQDQFKQQAENFLIDAETKQNILNCKISEYKLEIDDQKKIIQQLNYENDDLRKDNQQLEENYNDIERQLRDFTINQQKPEILETLRQQDIKSCNNSVYYTEIDTIIRNVPTPKGNFESMFSKTISKFEADVNQHRVTQVEIKSNREIILEKTINELKRKFKQLEKQQLIFCKKAEEDIKVFSEKCENYVHKINEQREEIKSLTQSYNSEYIQSLNKQCVEQSEYIVQMSQMLMNKPKAIKNSGKSLQMKQLRIIEGRYMKIVEQKDEELSIAISLLHQITKELI